jgi:hypothetical protein
VVASIVAGSRVTCVRMIDPATSRRISHPNIWDHTVHVARAPLGFASGERFAEWFGSTVPERSLQGSHATSDDPLLLTVRSSFDADLR